MNKKFRFPAAAEILAGCLLFFACSAQAVTNIVTYGNYYFSPEVIHINVGDTVEWKGTGFHTLLGTGADPICGGNSLPCSHTFTNAGSFPYICTLHFRCCNQTGLVVVAGSNIITEPLAVTVNPVGSGTVAPNLNGASLIVSNQYTIAAIPGRGQVFSNWSGIVQSESQTLTFVMPPGSNSILTANFIPSPFDTNGVAGAYSGLFWDTNNLSNEAAGRFAATLASSGVITGIVNIAGVPAAFATNLYADGTAAFEVKRSGLIPLVVTLQADLTGLEALAGTVSDVSNSFNATLIAHRAGFGIGHPAKNYEGYYTWTMSGGTADAPAGYSFGTARVGPLGGVLLNAFLSDGSSVIESGAISSGGEMPLYLPLYGGKGSLLSWLSFTNFPGTLTTNGAFWFKNPVAAGSYRNGFSLTNLSLWVGAYVAEGLGTNALSDTNVSMQFSGADLTNTLIEPIDLRATGIGVSGTNLTLTVVKTNGLFGGLFRDSATGKLVRYKGAVLHPVPSGYGYFISSNLSGAVLVQPQ